MQKINASEFRRVVRFVLGWDVSRADILRIIMRYCETMYTFCREEHGYTRSSSYEMWGSKRDFLEDYLMCRGYWDTDNAKLSNHVEWVDVPEGFMKECKYVQPRNMEKYKRKANNIREAEEDEIFNEVPENGRF